MWTNISIRLLRFASLASTLLVIFEEWQKGRNKTMLLGKMQFGLSISWETAERNSLCSLSEAKKDSGQYDKMGKEPSKTEDWKGQTLAVFVKPQGIPESQINY